MTRTVEMHNDTKYKVEKRTRWECPEDGGPALLTMPNLPRPTHGPGMQPRTIFGRTAWNRMRKRSYYLAKYRSEISGELAAGAGQLQSHEVFTINYMDGTSVFKRVFAITPLEHIYFIHSGRALTLHKQGNPMYSAKKLLEGAEHGFKLIYEWNKAHPDEKKLKAYSTFLDYLKCDDLKEDMEKLIDKYEMEFWEEDKSKCAKWGDWKVIVGTKEYPTPYKSYEDWKKAMEKQSQNDPDRNFKSPFEGDLYDEVNKLLHSEDII